PGTDAITLSACIIAAQLVMVGVAWGVGKSIRLGCGRKTIFLVALVTLPIRGLLFSFTTNPFGIVGIQLLDGLAAGIFGVIAILIASDLMRGTGRFNFAQGLVALSVGIGAGLSNLTSGFVVQWYGYPAGFFISPPLRLWRCYFLRGSCRKPANPATKANNAPAPRRRRPWHDRRYSCHLRHCRI